MKLADRISEELLPRVRQPGQYIGGEWNQLVKPGDWDSAAVRVAVAFPDAYAIGMSHLGCQILYWLCNHIGGVCAERVYTPWLDAEQVMRQRRIPLFTWDTRRPVAEVDILAVSLQYEMLFTNILTMLDLADIPRRSVNREDHHPLVIAGGPQADNPEPVADFFDLIVFGDGEHSMAGIIEAHRELKRQGASRREIIVECARRFPWIYAPGLYEVTYNEDGTIRERHRSSLCPHDFEPPAMIGRCRTPDFEDAPFPVRPLVPYTEVVHDRISIEIMRGCPQLCRFCHAGYTKRPLTLRSVARVLEIAEEAWRTTGLEEIGLLSLSTADYPHLRELAEKINERFADRRVNLSVPSLRVDKMLANIPWMVKSVRKSGLTIAAEAARDDMRAAIRKKVTDGNLLEGVKQAFAAGWRNVKLYFMCGFPGEREEDITGIFDLAYEVSQARRAIKGSPASVTASVSWLVPKPFTPFQWAGQPRAAYFNEARRLLREASGSRRSAVRIKTHSPERSILEAVFARGDRKLAATIEKAHDLGARFDAWDEAFDDSIWQEAFSQTGLDPAFYAHRERSYDEILPWDHISNKMTRDWLEKQYDDVYVSLNVPRQMVPVTTGQGSPGGLS